MSKGQPYIWIPIDSKHCPDNIEGRPSKACWRCKKAIQRRKHGDFYCGDPIIKTRFMKRFIKHSDVPKYLAKGLKVGWTGEKGKKQFIPQNEAPKDGYSFRGLLDG